MVIVFILTHLYLVLIFITISLDTIAQRVHYRWVVNVQEIGGFNANDIRR
jgi:hypothetical protein